MNFKRNKPEATIMEITPEIAQEMISTSQGNRQLRPWYVSQLAAAMKRGEWRVTSQGIGFDVNGHLRDAHHRLHACIRANVSFPSVVVMGMQTNAYEVTDTGILRTYADRLDIRREAADVIRLGVNYAISVQMPTVDQMRPFINAGLGDAVMSLLEFCGRKRRYYSSAPVKLAACVTIMNGGDADFILGQYRAMCLLDYAAMTKATQSLVRQVDDEKVRATNPRDALTRALYVFDEKKQDVSKIQVKDSGADAAVAFVRSVLNRSVELMEMQENIRKHTRKSNNERLAVNAWA